MLLILENRQVPSSASFNRALYICAHKRIINEYSNNKYIYTILAYKTEVHPLEIRRGLCGKKEAFKSQSKLHT